MLSVRVTPRMDAPPAPPRLAMRAEGLVEHVTAAGVAAATLTVSVRDCFGNALAGTLAAALLGSRPVRLIFERADADHTWAPAPAAAAPYSALLDAADGVVRFAGVVACAAADWPDGAYRLLARVHGAGADVADSADAWEFEYTSAATGASRMARQRASADQLRRRTAAEAAAAEAEDALEAQTRVHAAAVDAATAAASALAAMGAGVAPRVLAAAACEARPPELVMDSPPPYVALYRTHALTGASPRALFLLGELLSGEGADVAAVLAAAAGGRVMQLLVRTQANVNVLLTDTVLGNTLVALPLEDNVDLVSAAEDVHHVSGQRPLLLPPVTSPGFVGYLVNLVRLSADQRAVRVAVGGTLRGGPRPQQLGLRATALHHVFGRAALFTTRAAMLAHNALHGAGGGLYCLEDASRVGKGGVRYGSGAGHPPLLRAGVAPEKEWRDAPLRADARVVLAANAARDAAAAATQQLELLEAARDAAVAERAAARAAAPRAAAPPAPVTVAGRVRARPEPDAGDRSAPNMQRRRR
jgi:hypothetical protein